MARTDRQRPATLRTIAQAAGVDVSTVSRVLNGSAEDAQRAASRETADEIRRWAARLNYRPNPHATSLRTARSNLVGVLVPRLSDLVLATIYEGVEDAAARHGLTTFVMNSHDRPEQQRVRTELALSRRVDGLVFGDAHTDAAFLDEIAERRIPFVLVSRHAGRHPAVTCDDHLGGPGWSPSTSSASATAGWASSPASPSPAPAPTAPPASSTATATRASRCPAPTSSTPGSTPPGGRDAAEALLRLEPRPTAIFAVNDFSAIGALGVLRDHGLRPGKDVAVAGYNDTPLAAELPIPLTSVRSPMRQMGAGPSTCSSTCSPDGHPNPSGSARN
ncbi:LacI family DNA-binding transcriptional regulator [Actinomadura madurae]|uniref:LacI family DNA-binding transcriptional regulator n=1 Tax=Actinomadura madurae TaxID=1993 RepID=UPI0020D22CBD|nr:LacI family DNA-binding transcriptional regulator [Actinomadura madurae]MCP9981389.1 LacI family transcriptional regulator [Actinomadura madurae]